MIVISKKKKKFEFMDELGLFTEEKPICTKNKFPSLCHLHCHLPSTVCLDFIAVQIKILSARFLKDAFKLETSSFGSLQELVLLGLFLIF
jgi:hypothetical protein